jgi:DNA polymerase-3 subunit alpha
MKKLGKADKKQSDIDKWDETVNRFIDGAIKNGLSKAEAEMVANDLLKMSSYSFNKSHSVAYTYTGIMTLYLSHYFKPYFYSATLTYEASKQNSDLKKIINDCKISGFNILPPDVNKSNIHFSPDENNIRFGLNEIKLVGEKPSLAIIKNRPYASIIDFYVKNMGEGINKRTIIALIQSGAFDELINKERKKYTFIFEQFNEKKKATKVIEKLKFLWDTIENDANSIPGLETFHFHYVDYEKEYFGFPIFHSPFSEKIVKTLVEMNKRGLTELYFDELGDLKPLARIPVNVESYRTLIDKNGNEMAFFECVDLTGTNKRIPIFQSYWKHVKENFTGEGIYLMLLYYDIEKQEIYFGSKKWTDDSTKRRMLKRINL